MHWAGSLFLCLCGILLFIWFIPLRIRFMLEYQKGWKAAVTVSALWLSRTFELPGDYRTGQTYIDKHATRNGNIEKKRTGRYGTGRTSFQIHWRRTARSAAAYIKIMARHVRLEQYQVRCRVGFSRPDITAYSYGLFWAVLSAIPQAWLQTGSVTYLPDFQQKRQELYADGIIYCRVGQIIRMMISVFRLTTADTSEQNTSAGNRKEQIAYES